MDGECASLLPGVCALLADSGRSLPDDTCLEKLLDWFTELTMAGGSLLESCPCLLDFISTVVRSAASDADVLSFTLKLTGLLAATEDGFRKLQERRALVQAFNLQHWKQAGLWEDPCFRIGWVQGLKKSLQNPQALSFFVGSAANQVLAHILLFFQPASPAGRNGGQVNAGGGLAITDEEQEYHTCVKRILEHLKDSLVLEDHTPLRQSLQTLRLLAVLLDGARPPLRDRLVRTLSGSLEDLVPAGCSELTAPLMEVILSAYSSGADDPEQRVRRLLSIMLSMNKPPDLIRAAAAFLRSSHHDAEHTSRAVRILLLPLSIVTGVALLGSKTSGGDQDSTMIDHLKKKSSCISAVCVCVTKTPTISFLPSDVLPCPPALIVSSVLTLLHICSGVSSSSSSDGVSSSSSSDRLHVCRNLIGSAKVQKCALEALTHLSSSPGAMQTSREVFPALVQYLDNPDSDPTVLQKCFQALLSWISECPDVSVLPEELREGLASVVKKRTCDVRWEVRDSTVEFLGHLSEVSPAAGALLGGCSSTALLRGALQDTESYVRASAVSALAKTQTVRWQQGALLSQEESDIAEQLLQTLAHDTEGFARRAALQYFISWFSSCSSPPPSLMACVRSVLSQGSADLDWEVKCHTLELAELLLEEAFSGQRGHRRDSDTHDPPQPGAVVGGALEWLVDQGVVSVLLGGLVDCDRPVALKACRLLMTLRERVCSPPQGPESVCPPPQGVAAAVRCDLPGWGWGAEIRKVLETKTQPCNGGNSGGEGAGGGGGVTVCVCDVLTSLSLDEKLAVLMKRSDHAHNTPLSLLQDILTPTHARSHTDEGQEVIVDCY